MEMVEQGLYSPDYEHDACGVGLLVNINGTKSHDIVEKGLKVLEHMVHRGAENADLKSGDGAGIMLQIPHEFILLQGIPVPEKGRYGTGLVFLPKNVDEQAWCIAKIKEIVEKESLKLISVRDVPVDSSQLGDSAQFNEPDIKQIFVTGDFAQDVLERKLYVTRKKIEKAVLESTLTVKRSCYVVSLSTRTIILQRLSDGSIKFSAIEPM